MDIKSCLTVLQEELSFREALAEICVIKHKTRDARINASTASNAICHS